MRYFLILLLSAGPLFADDWPGFLGPRGDGSSTETGLLKAFPATGPTVVWRKDIGSGFAGPVVVKDRVVLFHRVDDEERVEALDAKDGSRLWKFAYPTEFKDDFGKGNGPRSTPAIGGSRVVTLGADGWLHCLNLETGAKVWGRHLPRDFTIGSNYFGVGSSPVIFEDRVLVNVGGKGAGIVAFGLEDGKEIWKATDHAASYSTPTFARIEGEPRALFLTREGAVMLDPRTGATLFTKRWRARYDASVNAASPLMLGDGRAFFSTSYETGGLLVKLTKDGGEPVWTNDETMSNHYNTCVVSEGMLYGIDGRQESGARLRCVDPARPKVLWTQERFGCASLLIADKMLIILTERGDLILAEANPRQYRSLAQAKILTATPVRAAPALSNGRLYLRDARQMKCVDLRAAN